MLYNKSLGKVQNNADCLACPRFNRKKKCCEGFGIVCFEYDSKTGIAIDPVTKLPINLKEGV